MAKRYVPISKAEMDKLMVEECGFQLFTRPGTWEYLYQRQIVGKDGDQYPMWVRVYSSVDVSTNTTRPLGEDSIKVVLVTTALREEMRQKFPDGLPVRDKHFPGAHKRLFRTKNALSSLREACRSMFWLGKNIACPNCKAPLAPREGRNGRFYGCTMYPTCQGTKEASVVERERPVEKP